VRPGFYSLALYRQKAPFFQGARGLLTTQKEEWHRFRSQVQQPMLRPKSTHVYAGDMEQVADDFIENRILYLRDDRMEMPDNFLSEMYRFGLESVACVALNVRLGCLEPDLSPTSEQVKDVFLITTRIP
jgi:cytochrome P450